MTAPPTPPGAESPVKVLYIVGWGHSGSTLLDLIIGTAPEVRSVGEIVFFDYYAREIEHEKVLREFACTCGERFRACPFWTRVLGSRMSTPPRVVHDASNRERLRWLFRLVRRFLCGSRRYPAASLGEDSWLLRRVLECGEDGAHIVCDSSKDFGRLARLLLQPEIEVHPIFLVRDGRAVARSYAKKRRVELGFRKVGFFQGLALWTGVNLLSWLAVLLSRRPATFVSYEELCRDTERTIARLRRELGIAIPTDTVLETIRVTRYHNVGGNLVRFKTIDAIRYDDAWRRTTSAVSRVIATVLLAPWNALWLRKRNGSPRTRSTPPPGGSPPAARTAGPPERPAPARGPRC